MQHSLSTCVVVCDPAFSATERVAWAGFLAGYSRCYSRRLGPGTCASLSPWCDQHHLDLFAARRADVECYGRALKERGLAPATVARRLCSVAGFCRYAEEEGLIAVSPAVHVRRPGLDYESYAIGSDRNEVGAFLVAAGMGPAVEHARISRSPSTACGSQKRPERTSRRSGWSEAIAP